MNMSNLIAAFNNKTAYAQLVALELVHLLVMVVMIVGALECIVATTALVCRVVFAMAEPYPAGIISACLYMSIFYTISCKSVELAVGVVVLPLFMAESLLDDRAYYIAVGSYCLFLLCDQIHERFH